MLSFFKIWGEKIGPLTCAALVTFALFLDGIQAIFDALTPIPYIGIILGPVVGEYFTIIGGTFLISWLWYLGAPFVTRFTLAAVIEFIPLINMLPAFTGATILSIMAANNKSFGMFLSFATLKSVTALAGAASIGKNDASQIPERADPGHEENAVSERGGFGRSQPTFKAPPTMSNDTSQGEKGPPNDGLLVKARQRVSA